ncbi:hypothetical protein HW115_01975 [Verrucomicrobiaceae bacterium N1E253]|uniref:Uncharacterized protein n=1 Tax=Oceaniferula marina TaxID=2748318 RepID=A0A851GBP9_9BACT|nr:hypothetical protein [Oceaniferula marina]NWK54362.1 hypothetical protein [Oceaniferula marina]
MWNTTLRLLFLTAILSPYAWACQVPVFRYALERWESDTYQLFLTSPGALDKPQTEWVKEFQQKLKHTNLKLNIIDTSRLSEAQLWQLPEIDTSAKEARLQLFRPNNEQQSSGQTKPILNTAFNEVNLNHLIDSPARRHIVDRLLEGSSCVWLIIHNNQEAKAKEIQSELNTHLRTIEKQISIPEGIIGTAERHKINEDTDLEDVLRSQIPLKIAFSSHIINTQTPEEAAFVAQLIHSSGSHATLQSEPLVIPVFGRGRKLPAMPSSMLSLETLLRGCQYLCGACSCQVKEQNPGADLIINENWSSHLTSGLAVIDKELPPLAGVGDLTKSHGNTSSPAPKQDAELGNEDQPNVIHAVEEPANQRFPIWITLASLFAIITLCSILAVKRKAS